MNTESEQKTTEITKEKEFLKISDMLEKLGVTRTQFWRMRKAGEVPPPVIKNPQMWLASKVNAFYESRANKESDSSL
ncbi:helix-turn-helix transcriptional regulator [Methylomonas sp. BW4-1]|uniref:helix-turn-helix transcriptional regulator n=1 Tax=Methylomonas sp. BW4-1 TaxID=3376685 RepID=UPI004042730D